MAMKKRTLAVGLDGFEISVAREMMDQGKLPFMAGLLERSATFDLDHGEARYSGLAWEHFSTGQDPDSYGRWSAVTFDPASYRIVQETTRHRPFTDSLPLRIVGFDIPYCDLDGGQVLGMANWGAHDPGVSRHSNPAELVGEIEERFGSYPAGRYIYGYVWPFPERTADMAARLAEAVRMRTAIVNWLFGERCPDWDLAIAVTSEMHSGLEALWHGWDSTHRLHDAPSAAAARQGIENIYIETDRMLAELSRNFPDAALVVFSMHGMGPNLADVPNMALLPELLHRLHFKKPNLHPHPDWVRSDGCEIGPYKDWSRALHRHIGGHAPGSLAARLARLGEKLRQGRPGALAGKQEGDLPLSWMPSTRYARYWPQMPAFALPSFYDGQVRVNLAGREAGGMVSLDRYAAVLDEIEEELRQLRDHRTGEPVVERFVRPVAEDPLAATGTQCDLRIVWRLPSTGFDHPRAGRIGPVPVRRTGGHTGDYGFAILDGTPLPPGSHGVASSFDIVPTLIALSGMSGHNAAVSGRSLV